jgi:hypothetical protein
MNRRICSYDLAAVTEDGYVVTDDGGAIYFCTARCLCIWAVSLATKPGLTEELKARRLVLKVPAGEELVFETITGLARWASLLAQCDAQINLSSVQRHLHFLASVITASTSPSDPSSLRSSVGKLQQHL